MMHYLLSSIISRGRLLPTLALLTAMLLWGSSFVAMKLAFRELSPMVVVFGRMAVAALCFVPFIPFFRRVSLGKEHLPMLLAMGFFEPCLYFLLEAAALQNTSASQAAMITTMLPLMVAMAAGFFLGERIGLRTVLGFVLAAAGAIWLSCAAGFDQEAPRPALGNFLEFLAMISATGYIILMKYLSRDLPPFFLTAVQAFIGTVFFLPLIFLPATELPRTITISGLGAVVYLGIAVTVGAYGLYKYGISKVPANQAAAFINLIPVFTIVMGFLILDERLRPWQIVACLLVFAGVMFSQNDPEARDCGSGSDTRIKNPGRPARS